MNYDMQVNHPSAAASVRFILNALQNKGSVVLDPQSSVTLAMSYLHLTAAHQFIEEEHGDARCMCGAWFYTADIVSPYHDERQKISWQHHVDTGKYMTEVELHEEMRKRGLD